MKAGLCAAALMALPHVAGAVECARQEYLGNRYTQCQVDMTQDTLRLFLNNDAGEVFGFFGSVDAHLAESGQRLGFAMNAGMYHEDRAPVGHYVEDGVEVQRVITSDGPGNFGLLPNGVLCLREGRADVFETLDFVAQAPECQHATQSGPLLVIDGALHPRFLKDGTSKFIRNGVGTSADGTVATFVISDDVVNFYDFAVYFRDVLGVPNALYFDGNVSRMRAPSLDRDDAGFFSIGPIIGVVEPAG